VTPIDIYHLIDRLERMLEKGVKVPLSNYTLINEDEFITIVDQMRSSIPHQVRHAEQIQQRQQQILAEAQEEVERLIQGGQQEAERLASEHELARKAEQKAEMILERARADAVRLRSEADEYAREVLYNLDGQLAGLSNQVTSLLSTVRNGLETLTTGHEPTAGEEA
jgi:cell division septum initiation protein DivIVA